MTSVCVCVPVISLPGNMKFRGGGWGSENGVSFNANPVYVNSCCLLGVSPIHRNLPAQECSPPVTGELLFLGSSLGSNDVLNNPSDLLQQNREGTVEAFPKTFTVSLAPVAWFGSKYHMKQSKTCNSRLFLDIC